MATFVPLISSGTAGPLGVLHLPRMWLKISLEASGKLDSRYRGAGQGYDGTSGVHTHMTNTAITDPEILEHRYPVRLHRFALRSGSGGKGKWHGGDGIMREVEFLAPLHVSLLTQHREIEPYGMDGGECGTRGKQFLNGIPLPGITAFVVKAGDRLLIETPGGGGYGSP